MAKSALIGHPRRAIVVLAPEARVALAACYRLPELPAVIERDQGEDDDDDGSPQRSPESVARFPLPKRAECQRCTEKHSQHFILSLLNFRKAVMRKAGRCAREYEWDAKSPNREELQVRRSRREAQEQEEPARNLQHQEHRPFAEAAIGISRQPDREPPDQHQRQGVEEGVALVVRLMREHPPQNAEQDDGALALALCRHAFLHPMRKPCGDYRL